MAITMALEKQAQTPVTTEIKLNEKHFLPQFFLQKHAWNIQWNLESTEEVWWFATNTSPKKTELSQHIRRLLQIRHQIQRQSGTELYCSQSLEGCNGGLISCPSATWEGVNRLHETKQPWETGSEPHIVRTPWTSSFINQCFYRVKRPGFSSNTNKQSFKLGEKHCMSNFLKHYQACLLRGM